MKKKGCGRNPDRESCHVGENRKEASQGVSCVSLQQSNVVPGKGKEAKLPKSAGVLCFQT